MIPREIAHTLEGRMPKTVNYASVHKEVLVAWIRDADEDALNQMDADLARNGSPAGGMLRRAIALRRAVVRAGDDEREKAAAALDEHIRATIFGITAARAARSNKTLRTHQDEQHQARLAELLVQYKEEKES